MQIYLQFFRMGSPKSYARMRSSAVSSRNAQSPLEQIVRSEAKIRKGRRIIILANCQKKGTIIAMLCTSQ